MKKDCFQGRWMTLKPKVPKNSSPIGLAWINEAGKERNFPIVKKNAD